MDGPIPYRADALAMKKKYAADALREDAEVKCYLPGVPRMMYMPYPVQIVQSDSTIMMMSEFASALRTIYMNSNTRPPPIPGWDGRTASGMATHWSSTPKVSWGAPSARSIRRERSM